MSVSQSNQTLLEVKIQCPPVLAAYLQELLWTLDGVESVTEHYQSNPEHDQTQPVDLSCISLLTRNPLGEDLVKVLLVENPKLLKVCDIIDSRWIEEKDWLETWKQSWEECTPQSSEEVVIRLDPECAFGTGSHETTRLMLKAMEQLAGEIDFSQTSVLDVGTGSGILAIYAAKLGSHNVRGVDNDPLAVETAIRNAELNGVASVTDFTGTPLAELCQTQYDVVLANIIAPVILELFDDMCLRLTRGGYFLASGLIEKSVGVVAERMKSAGFTDIQQLQDGDWYALRGVYGNL
jgi:ribosomal protein L11 methyltransferase